MAGNHLTARTFLAREIRLAREAKGMSRGALGKAVFVSESLVTAWEKGRYLPKPDVMDRLEGTLGTRGVLTRMLDDLVSVTVPLEWFGRWVEIEGQA
ncbi:MAG TPA: helix-turn-helix transcriptional regulator, partial [Actinomadura sp.]|nr:helix-turn-helix transcriptional regulator [Actinomadura sp.]